MPVHKGYDPDGAQVQVETGTGVVTRIDGLGAADETGEHRNYRVILSATHSARMRQPVTALTTRGEPTLAAARAAMASGQPLDYTIQLRRRAEVDPTIPIETLKATVESARDNLRRILTGLGDATSSEAVPVSRTHPHASTQTAPSVVLALVTNLLATVADGDTARIAAARAAVEAIAPTGADALLAAAHRLQQPAATPTPLDDVAPTYPRYGEPGFQSPTAAQTRAFHNLFAASGQSAPTVTRWLQHTFGVTRLIQVHTDALAAHLDDITTAEQFTELLTTTAAQQRVA